MATGTEIKQAEAGRKSGVRTRIIDAAWDLGHTETPTKLTVRNIAMRAGVSPAHLYTYFDSKTELVQELQRRAAPRLLSALADALDGAETPAEQLLRTCLAYVGFARDHRWLCVGANGYHEHDASSLSDTFQATAGGPSWKPTTCRPRPRSSCGSRITGPGRKIHLQELQT